MKSSTEGSGRVRRLRRMAGAVLDLVYPRHCAGCEISLAGGDEPFLCGRCRDGLTILDADLCLRCGRGLGPHVGVRPSCGDCRGRRLGFRRAIAGAEFAGAWRRVIHRFKFSGERVLAPLLVEPVAARIAAEMAAGRLEEIEAFVPVPLAGGRERRRGFNQSRLLAEACGRRLGIPVLDVARRVRETTSQVGQGREKRFANLEGAFGVSEAHRDEIVGRRLCIVDDILTTGATASALGHALRAAGARVVYVAAAARKS